MALDLSMKSTSCRTLDLSYKNCDLSRGTSPYTCPALHHSCASRRIPDRSHRMSHCRKRVRFSCTESDRPSVVDWMTTDHNQELSPFAKRRLLNSVDSDEEYQPSNPRYDPSDIGGEYGDLHLEQQMPYDLRRHPTSVDGRATSPGVSSEDDLNKDDDDEDDDDDNVFVTLPYDPREWSRVDVHNWLKYMSVAHSLNDVKHDRFLMNGKALCLMNVDMFSYRVPLGGKLLYRDFRMRLSQALAAPSRM